MRGRAAAAAQRAAAPDRGRATQQDAHSVETERFHLQKLNWIDLFFLWDWVEKLTLLFVLNHIERVWVLVMFQL